MFGLLCCGVDRKLNDFSLKDPVNIESKHKHNRGSESTFSMEQFRYQKSQECKDVSILVSNTPMLKQ